MERYGSRPTYIELDLEALAQNMESLREHLPSGTEVMAVVKANAYGHGAVPIARAALKAGATRLAVALLEEGLELRRAGIEAPILVLGVTDPGALPYAQREQIAVTLFSEEQVARAISTLSFQLPPLRVHLKVDTGMHRIGFLDPASFLRAARRIDESEVTRLDGLFSHFSTADEPVSQYSKVQHQRFEEWIDLLKREGIRPGTIHMNNSAGSFRFPEWSHSMVRFGISLYGLSPSEAVKEEGFLPLQPVLSLKSQIIQLKELPAGEPVSYGGTFVTARRTRVATLPVGYGDGVDRRLSNRGAVLVRGRRAPIIGRVCMDQLMIDVTDIPGAKEGDEAVLIGRQGTAEISADEIAFMLDTINYELVTRLSSRLPRLLKER